MDSLSRQDSPDGPFARARRLLHQAPRPRRVERDERFGRLRRVEVGDHRDGAGLRLREQPAQRVGREEGSVAGNQDPPRPRTPPERGQKSAERPFHAGRVLNPPHRRQFSGGQRRFADEDDFARDFPGGGNDPLEHEPASGAQQAF